jgi:LSD1 subclass zinc finger protein
MKTKRDLANEQIDLQKRVQDLANVNIVTCGNCGNVLLHDTSAEEIVCASCHSDMDVSDCPDLWYEGCQNNPEFNDEPTISVDDVVKVAMDLGLNPTIGDINEVIKYFPSESSNDPTASWGLVVENLLYNCVTP